MQFVLKEVEGALERAIDISLRSLKSWEWILCLHCRNSNLHACVGDLPANDVNDGWWIEWDEECRSVWSLRRVWAVCSEDVSDLDWNVATWLTWLVFYVIWWVLASSPVVLKFLIQLERFKCWLIRVRSAKVAMSFWNFGELLTWITWSIDKLSSHEKSFQNSTFLRLNFSNRWRHSLSFPRNGFPPNSDFKHPKHSKKLANVESFHRSRAPTESWHAGATYLFNLFNFLTIKRMKSGFLVDLLAGEKANRYHSFHHVCSPPTPKASFSELFITRKSPKAQTKPPGVRERELNFSTKWSVVFRYSGWPVAFPLPPCVNLCIIYV